MSRPFSYNDEKFTVIGNLLIIHIPFEGSIDINQFISEVPPEIVKRIPYAGFVGSYNKNPFSPTIFTFYIGNNSLYSSTSANLSGGQFFAITNLKDI